MGSVIFHLVGKQMEIIEKINIAIMKTGHEN